MDEATFEQVLDILNVTYPDHPMADLTAGQPYKVLIACLLSLRTKDDTSIPASNRLFQLADTPERMVALSAETIQKVVFPVGFYRNKSQTILNISQDILTRFGGTVPDTVETLLTLKGVGRKTANLVVGLGHRLPAVCVDVHVHRITQRLGYLHSKDPEETEMILRKRVPQSYWPVINRVLVRHGQEICKPVGPRCDICPVGNLCEKSGVKPRAIAIRTKLP